MFPTSIQTERLVLERFCAENVDVDELYARFGVDAPHADAVFGQISDEPFETERDAVAFVEQAESEWEAHETGMYAVAPRANEDGGGECAGYAHLWMDWDRRKAELGLLLDRPFWGREYATEVYLALTETAFDLHGVDVVGIGHPVQNTNSQRSIEKFIEAANGTTGGTIPNHEWVGGTLCDSRRYAVARADFTGADR